MKISKIPWHISPTMMFKIHKHSIVGIIFISIFPKDEHDNRCREIRTIYHLFCLATVRWTVETPSTNFVRKRTFALLNMPSFSDTTINCILKEPKEMRLFNLLDTELMVGDLQERHNWIYTLEIMFQKRRLRKSCHIINKISSTWECGKWFFIIFPMFCVWLKSRAASTCNR
jgi:hypothetical protein